MLYNHVGGVSPQPPPVCSIHLDDATAATGQQHQCTHHTPATGGEEREIEPIKCMGIIRHIHIHDMTGQDEIIGLRLVIIFLNFFINTTYVHYLTTIFVTHFSVISDITAVSSRLILKRSEYLKHQTIMSCLPSYKLLLWFLPPSYLQAFLTHRFLFIFKQSLTFCLFPLSLFSTAIEPPQRN